jgi:hypothetical protein
MASSMKTADANEAVGPEEEQIPAEMLAVIAAAATVFLGSRLRILSAKLRHSPKEPVSRWLQQGRTHVQVSHNLRQKR